MLLIATETQPFELESMGKAARVYEQPVHVSITLNVCLGLNTGSQDAGDLTRKVFHRSLKQGP